ncbi:hypothetical protein LMG29542_06820 [Paraburkholderia humisilvae]|uniref:Uncharacterized protein n=1 Tax=Paraburkholderia humisilvae TaxID=627669 RepID=A0A6J5F4F1_9BURK|nr:hypothetical protein LMG29542_06820 [Paraburkholderia humisilvae]
MTAMKIVSKLAQHVAQALEQQTASARRVAMSVPQRGMDARLLALTNMRAPMAMPKPESARMPRPLPMPPVARFTSPPLSLYPAHVASLLPAFNASMTSHNPLPAGPPSFPGQSPFNRQAIASPPATDPSPLMHRPITAQTPWPARPAHEAEPLDAAEEETHLQQALRLSLECQPDRPHAATVAQPQVDTSHATVAKKKNSVDAFLEDIMTNPPPPQRLEGATKFEQLPDDIRQAYGDNEFLYLQELTITHTSTSHIEEVLKRHSMRLVKNDGTTMRLGKSKVANDDMRARNNCLLISLLQHVTGNYTRTHDRIAHQYRLALASLAHNPLGRDEKVSASNHAVSTLVDWINNRSDFSRKLQVSVVTQIGDQVFIDKIPPRKDHDKKDAVGTAFEDSQLHKVVIVDCGTHFEAVCHE